MVPSLHDWENTFLSQLVDVLCVVTHSSTHLPEAIPTGQESQSSRLAFWSPKSTISKTRTPLLFMHSTASKTDTTMTSLPSPHQHPPSTTHDPVSAYHRILAHERIRASEYLSVAAQQLAHERIIAREKEAVRARLRAHERVIAREQGEALCRAEARERVLCGARHG